MNKRALLVCLLMTPGCSHEHGHGHDHDHGAPRPTELPGPQTMTRHPFFVGSELLILGSNIPVAGSKVLVLGSTIQIVRWKICISIKNVYVEWSFIFLLYGRVCALPDPKSVARDSRLPGCRLPECRLPESLQTLLFRVLRRQGVIYFVTNLGTLGCVPMGRKAL